jgi:hypothetical protein
MKHWTSILTAGAILALAAPAGNAATSNIPSDPGSNAGSSVHRPARVSTDLSRKSVLTKKQHVKRTWTIGTSDRNYFPYAYVPGGSSPKVAQAITDAAERMQAR